MLTRSLKHATVFALVLFASVAFGSSSASAHPLGNFTTNTATRLVVSQDSINVVYVVDMAEIPALKVRQSLNSPSGAVPVSVAKSWSTSMCSTVGNALVVQSDGLRVPLESQTSLVTFPPGQAGLTTLRLECEFSALVDLATTTGHSIAVIDGNFPDRLGWREITAVGDRLAVSGGIDAVSPTNLLTKYPSGAVTSPLHQTDVAFVTGRGASRSNIDGLSPATNAVGTRGNDGLTQRFQSLVARRELSPLFVTSALFIALVLGGLHALAPGHGKTIMAAYAVTRKGRRGDILSIGLTVALTHTIGILILGTIISATSVVSSEGALRWASVASGLLVMSVGLSLVRSRMKAARSARVAKGETSHHHLDHNHGDHDHDHSHGHDHPHTDDHAHAHPHGSDSRFVVTSHAHGGWQHEHVLPAPGAMVKRRELIAMGLAGGMVPSPSALVVLLAAIALGRIPFGLALVAAYGLGLAATLVAAGLLLVRFEQTVRTWGSRRSSPMGLGVTRVVEALPLVSGTAIVGAGMLLVVRSLSLL